MPSHEYYSKREDCFALKSPWEYLTPDIIDYFLFLTFYFEAVLDLHKIAKTVPEIHIYPSPGFS